MNGINVIRYGTEIHKTRLSQEFYELCRANIKAWRIILLIETKLRLPSELRLRFVDIKKARGVIIFANFSISEMESRKVEMKRSDGVGSS